MATNNSDNGNSSASQFDFFLEAVGGDMSVIKDNFDHLNRECDSLDLKIKSLDIAVTFAMKAYDLKFKEYSDTIKSLNKKVNCLIIFNSMLLFSLILIKLMEL